MPIHALEPDIVSKIAAGEVIERPCYALKELLENSIDAQATTIDIDLQHFGLNRIAVIDNGIGMSPDDLVLAAQRHTTSKIHQLADLSALATLGFRGEALAAICAVSHTTIRSRPVDHTKGHVIQIQAQVQSPPQPIGMPHGTQIIVEQLFANLPARKKFLHNTNTEYRYLIDIVTNVALAHPHIKFSLQHNDRHLFTLPTQSIADRHQYLLGQEIFSQLVPFEVNDTYFQATGYLAKPQLSTYSNHKQYIFINHRRVLSSAIANSIRDAYGTLLESAAYPVFVLHLTMRPEQIDINVHPRKETVYLLNQHEVLDSLRIKIREALFQHNLTTIDARWHLQPSLNSSTSQSHTHLKNTVNTATALQLREQVLQDYQGTKPKASADIFQLHQTYIITETSQGVLILDQHAAHERVLYEKFLAAYQSQLGSDSAFALPDTTTISVSPTDYALFIQFQGHLEQLGFQFAQHDSHTHLHITHVPAVLRDHALPQLLQHLFDDLREERALHLDVRSHRMLSYLACRSAIMAGDKLTKERMRTLIQELATCQTSYTCPHGRPVQVEIPLKSMHKIFKRL
jgi:DNA mismatch repair protein MutL